MWKKIVKWSIYSLIFLMPVFWLPFSFEAFDFNKTYLLIFLSSAGFLAWMAQMVFEDKKVKFKKGPLDVFILIFLLIMVLNGIFSIDKTSAWYGFYGRFWPNLAGIISLGIFYFLLVNNVKTETNGNGKPQELNEKGKKGNWHPATVKGALKAFLWSSGIVVLTAYLSVFGLWAKIGSFIKLPGIMSLKVFNTIGGSFQQLAVFLSVVFVLALTLSAFSLKGLGRSAVFFGKKEKPLIYLLLFSSFILLVLIDFWPSWLVVSVSLLLFLGFSFWKRVFREDVNRLSLSVLFLIISLVFLFFNPLQGFFRQIKVFGSLPQEIQLSQEMSWKVGINGLKENALLGSGIGTFSYLFTKYKPESFIKGPFWQIRFDRAANSIAERIGTSGVLGTAGYLLMVAMFLIISLLVLEYSAEKWEKVSKQVPLVLAFTALLAAQFVFYQNAVLAFSFWLFMGLGAVSWEKPQKEKTIKFRDFPELGLIVNILFWVIVLVVLFFYFTIGKFYAADVYYKGYLTSPGKNLAKLERSASLNSRRADYHIALAAEYLRMISEELTQKKPNQQNIIKLVALSIQEGRTATKVAPKMIAAKEALGVVYRDVQGLAQGALEWGIRTFREALKADPKNPVLLTELGKLLVIDNKKKEAESLFAKAASLRENYVPAIVQLAALKEKEGKKKEALKTLEDLVKKNPFSIQGRFELGRMYFNGKEYDKAAREFRAVLTLFPKHSNARYSLGLVYERQNRLRKALLEFEEVLKLNPNNELIAKKIKEIKRKISGGEKEPGAKGKKK